MAAETRNCTPMRLPLAIDCCEIAAGIRDDHEARDRASDKAL